MADRSPAAHLRMKQTLNHFQKQHNDVGQNLIRLATLKYLLPLQTVFPQDWSTNYATE